MFETVKSKGIISLFETVSEIIVFDFTGQYNSLKSIQEN